MVNQTAAQLRSELSILEAKTTRIRARLARMEGNPEAKELATRLHEVECNFDHNEHCGWQWEANNWNSGYAHREYLRKAESILETKTLSEALTEIGVSVAV